MASTESTNQLFILPTGRIASAKRIAYGVGTLSSGTVELVTGLGRVDGIWFTGLNTAATEALVCEVKEDLPTSTGTITVDGTLIDEGGATKDGGSSQFSWWAIGE